MAKETWSRRRAARGQLDTAIELVLFERDAVSAHVLASAASEVLRGLSKHAGKLPLDAQIENAIRPEKINFWRGAVNRSYNFFKHADRDAAKESIEFDPETTLFEILAGVHDYHLTFGTMTLPMMLFVGYLARSMPSLFTDEYLASVEPALGMFDQDGRPPGAVAAQYLQLYLNEGAANMQLPSGIEF